MNRSLPWGLRSRFVADQSEASFIGSRGWYIGTIAVLRRPRRPNIIARKKRGWSRCIMQRVRNEIHQTRGGSLWWDRARPGRPRWHITSRNLDSMPGCVAKSTARFRTCGGDCNRIS